ncbi:hypothetical protein Pcinc_038652 [Petrolisthes cinctipes]|uniref:Uncharacterized protein n=1 Tax=Petrolisthes cinctipes TaxID=88211 RepID=A0AAE1ELD5_PETCI|nr:hypothetical protein Pcinc_038652 [Petrolisthes cinctipes]
MFHLHTTLPALLLLLSLSPSLRSTSLSSLPSSLSPRMHSHLPHYPHIIHVPSTSLSTLISSTFPFAFPPPSSSHIFIFTFTLLSLLLSHPHLLQLPNFSSSSSSSHTCCCYPLTPPTWLNLPVQSTGTALKFFLSFLDIPPKDIRFALTPALSLQEVNRGVRMSWWPGGFVYECHHNSLDERLDGRGGLEIPQHMAPASLYARSNGSASSASPPTVSTPSMLIVPQPINAAKMPPTPPGLGQNPPNNGTARKYQCKMCPQVSTVT